MGTTKKTWQEKLEDNKGFPKVLELDPKFPCGKALEKGGAKKGVSVVLVRPMEVYEIMRQVPEGKLINIGGICKKLAKKHKTQFCCILTTGIFIMTAANAAAETNTYLPYWRTIKNNGELNEKYPNGVQNQKKFLENEGHTILKKGKKYFVKDFEEKLMS